MIDISLPLDVPDCTYTSSGRSVPSGLRACAVVVADVGEKMHANAAPAGIEGDPAEVVEHAMTNTASRVDAVSAAMITGLTALDAYCDRMDALKTTWHDLENMKGALDISVISLQSRRDASDAASDTTLETDIRTHNSKVTTYNSDIGRWQGDVENAENAVIAALGRADTLGEAERLVGSVPNVPTLLTELEELAKDPVAINAWWLALSAAEREALKVMAPKTIGNTDGIPIVDRDEANRAHLSALLNELKQKKDDGEELSSDEQEWYDQTQAVYDGLELADGEVDINGKPVPAFLMIFDPTAAGGDGYGAIAFGNPETADNVSVNVPGFGSKLSNIDGVAGSALDVRET
ncbi:MAG: hypothetical protein EON52_24035, partial [Actinomycetales bacterium]